MRGPGFDHAGVHEPTGRIYVAHAANDAVDVLDVETQKYLGSMGGPTGVAGSLVTVTPDLIFTSDRGENTVAIAALDDLLSGFASTRCRSEEMMRRGHQWPWKMQASIELPFPGS